MSARNVQIPDDELTPLEIIEAKQETQNLLPQKSKEKYIAEYNKFMNWRAERKIKSLSENIMLAYFAELLYNYTPSSLWAIYSMLKSTLNANNNVNIGNYSKLIAFLKRQSQGFKSKKSKVFTSEDIKKFLDEAPDDTYLAIKLAMIFGICGACRREELTNLTINDIEDKQNVILVKIQKTKPYKPRSFVIAEEFYGIFKKYILLRPKNVETAKFFLTYRNGKCISQPIGINKFGKMPEIIASYLNLPDPGSYTGHSFRRTSATLLANAGTDLITLKRYGGRKSSTVAEGYVEDSFNNNNKIGDKITNSITSKSTSASHAVKTYSRGKDNLTPSTSQINNVKQEDPVASKTHFQKQLPDNSNVSTSFCQSILVQNRAVQHHNVADTANSCADFTPVRTLSFLIKELKNVVKSDKDTSEIFIEIDNVLSKIPVNAGESLEDLEINVQTSTSELMESNRNMKTICEAWTAEQEKLHCQIKKEMLTHSWEDVTQELKDEITAQRLQIKREELSEEPISDLRTELTKQNDKSTLMQNNYIKYLTVERDKLLQLSSHQEMLMIKYQRTIKELQMQVMKEQLEALTQNARKRRECNLYLLS